MSVSWNTAGYEPEPPYGYWPELLRADFFVSYPVWVECRPNRTEQYYWPDPPFPDYEPEHFADDYASIFDVLARENALQVLAGRPYLRLLPSLKAPRRHGLAALSVAVVALDAAAINIENNPDARRLGEKVARQLRRIERDAARIRRAILRP